MRRYDQSDWSAILKMVGHHGVAPCPIDSRSIMLLKHL